MQVSQMRSPVWLADTVGAETAEPTPEQCAAFSVLWRWAHTQCYCPHFGEFYSQGSYSPGEELCPVHGLDSWRGKYWVYVTIEWTAFISLGVWCLVQLFRLHRIAGAALRRDIVAFCLASISMRLCYLTMVEVMINDPASPNFLESLIGTTYTIFFPLSASAFLCLCQHWRHTDTEAIRLLVDLQQIDANDPDLIDPWHTRCLRIVTTRKVALSLLVVHMVDGIGYVMDVSARFHSVYFMWLCMVGVCVALVGLAVALRLYRHLRVWAGACPQLFRKVVVSSVTVSALSIAFLGCGIYYAFYARWYASECFVYMCLSRVFEAMNTAVILMAVSQPSRLRSQSGDARTGSFVNSPAVMAADRQLTPLNNFNFMIDSASSSSVDDPSKWQDDLCGCSHHTNDTREGLP